MKTSNIRKYGVICVNAVMATLDRPGFKTAEMWEEEKRQREKAKPDFTVIQKAIRSCATPEHILFCRRMIEFFRRKHGEVVASDEAFLKEEVNVRMERMLILS